MSAPLRIWRPIKGAAAEDPGKEYLDRLVKMVPAEVISLYLAGKGAIQAYYAPLQGAGNAEAVAPHPFEGLAWLVWSLVCLAAVFVVRGWATSDKAAGLKPQWKAVLIAAGSFGVWVYSFGDGFASWGIWNPLIASLLVFAWSFFWPIFYKGDDAGGLLSGPLGRRTTWSQAQPKEFDSAQAEACVLDAAKALTNRAFSLSSNVSDGFSGEQALRGLLSGIQDLIKDRYGDIVDLASGYSDDLSEVEKKTFFELSIDVREKVNE